MRFATILAFASALGLAAAGHVAAAKPIPAAAPDLKTWFDSKQVLIDRFMAALEQRDNEALEKLRVSETEYISFILPGAVAPGEPLRKWPQDVSGYYYRSLNTRSLYSQQALLDSFGGRPLKLVSADYEEGTKAYANHTAYRQLRLKLQEADGKETTLATGSIVEVKGRYKFMSFVAD